MVTARNSGRSGFDLTIKIMKRIWIVVMLSISGAEQSRAGDVTETNAMPAPIRNLMETQGYAIKPSAFSLSTQNTNSQRNIQAAERTQFAPFEIPRKKTSWNLWDNSSIRHVGRTEAPMSPFSPPLAQYEYDITYTFGF